jgi:hypothetical protein
MNKMSYCRHLGSHFLRESASYSADSGFPSRYCAAPSRLGASPSDLGDSSCRLGRSSCVGECDFVDSRDKTCLVRLSTICPTDFDFGQGKPCPYDLLK